MRNPIKTWTKSDFTIDWFSGKGAGGQHRNKHQNCCRITHLETGLVAVGQNSRSRPANQKAAFYALVDKLIENFDLGPSQSDRNCASNVVRTYHFERNEVTDGSIKLLPKAVMDGNLDPFVERALTEGVN